MGNETDKKMQEDLRKVFRAVSEAPVRPDPYLATRVMARLRERREGKVGLSFWKWLGIGSTGLSAALALAFVLWTSKAGHYEAFVNRPFVVKMEVVDLQASNIARAEIRLPDGVYFDIEAFPDLRKKRMLALVWSNRDKSEFVPFVLTATEEGTKTITVRFFDENDNLVGEKRLDVRLKRKG